MMRVQRSSNLGVTLSLTGRIEDEDVPELQRLLDLEVAGQPVTLDLQDVTLVDREALRFLTGCEASGVRLENCPAYIREWIDTDRSRSQTGRRGTTPEFPEAD